MPRQWIRKTDRGVPADLLEKAAIEVKLGKSVRSVAKANSICHVTLGRYCKALQELKEKNSREQPRVGYRSSQKVFNEAQEEILTGYLRQEADLYYGLTPHEVRRFAYQLAVEYNIKHPKSWDEKSMAGPDWFSAFMKRHPNLSMRSAEAPSLVRATVNRSNVERFFKSLGEVTPAPPPTQLATVDSPLALAQLATSASPPAQLATSAFPPAQLATSASPPAQLATSASPPAQLATSASPPAQLATVASPPAQLATVASPPAQLATVASPPAQLATSAPPPAQLATSVCPPAQLATPASPPAQVDTIASPPIQMFHQAQIHAPCSPNVLNPSALRLFPRARPRKTVGGPRKRPSEILTDTPVKQALEEEEMGSSSENVKNNVFGKRQSKQNNTERKPTKKSSKPNQPDDSGTSEGDDFCIVCMERFENPRCKVVWGKCEHSKFWAHKACTPGTPTYICHHCDSD